MSYIAKYLESDTPLNEIKKISELNDIERIELG